MPDQPEFTDMTSRGRSDSPTNDEEGAVGGASRQHLESEGSLSGEENAGQGNRIRTGRGFVIPGVAASPPSFVSLEEIMKAAKGMNNMVLAHKIAVDENFELEKLEPSKNSVHEQVKETIHRAFWDLLSQQLEEDPPNYSQALVLLLEIRENLLSLLLPQHTKLKQEIMEVLDADVIQQQVEAGTLNFQEYAHYVISVMGKMCAPARDEKIKELTQMSEVVPVFKGVLETLDLMKLDMANFTIKLFRPNIIASSVEYEKQKFAEFLKIQVDGLAFTRTWLLRHLDQSEVEKIVAENSPVDPLTINKLAERTLAEAYLELLEWKIDEPFPETLVIDEARFRELGVRAARITVVGAVLLVTFSCVVALQGVAAFKQQLMEHINILLADTRNDQDMEKVLSNVAVQVIKDVNEALVKHGFKALDVDTERLLEGQIKTVAQADHKIKQLVRVRVREFLKQTITSPTAAPVRVPPGLSSLQVELTSITGHFLRLVSHNRAVFSQYYIDIVATAVGNR